VACKRQYQDLLWEAAESGDLPTALQNHLPACPRCREEWSLAQTAQRGFQCVQHVPKATRSIIVPEPGQPVGFPLRRIFALCGAAAVLILLACIITLSRSQRVASNPPMNTPGPHRNIAHTTHQEYTTHTTQVTLTAQNVTPVSTPEPYQHMARSLRRHHVHPLRAVPNTDTKPAPLFTVVLTSTPEPPSSPPVAIALSQIPIPPGTVTPLKDIMVDDAAIHIDSDRVTRLSDLPLSYDITPASPEQVQALERAISQGKSSI
jgi:hypothetical protein